MKASNISSNIKSLFIIKTVGREKTLFSLHKEKNRKKSKCTVETQAGINGMCHKNRNVSNKS